MKLLKAAVSKIIQTTTPQAKKTSKNEFKKSQSFFKISYQKVLICKGRVARIIRGNKRRSTQPQMQNRLSITRISHSVTVIFSSRVMGTAMLIQSFRLVEVIGNSWKIGSRSSHSKSMLLQSHGKMVKDLISLAQFKSSWS